MDSGKYPSKEEFSFHIADKSNARHNIHAFIRVRPLLKGEGDIALKGLSTAGLHHIDLATNIAFSGTKASRTKSPLTFSGFDGVFGWEEDNVAVYERAIAPHLSTVVYEGGLLSCFCFGHTGSGKTHTVMGYRGEPALYELCAQEIFDDISRIGEAGAEKLLLQITFAEIYNDKVFDLIGGRRECAIREDNKGQVHFRAPVIKTEDGKVLVNSLCTRVAHTLGEISDIMRDAVKHRSAGVSTTHSQSSRSHGLFEMEVVNEELIELRLQIVAAEGDVTKWGKLKDDVFIQQSMLQFEQVINADGTKAWREKPDWMHRKNDEIRAKFASLELRFGQAESELEKLRELEVKLLRGGISCLGGTVVFVDLAGSDYDVSDKKQDAKVMKEFREINKSLLALKECIRGIADTRVASDPAVDVKSKAFLPFRNSKLTRILRRVLWPLPTDDRGAVASQAVMIANISPAATMEKATLNTLRYVKMVKGE